jgi:hypothetical protein
MKYASILAKSQTFLGTSIASSLRFAISERQTPFKRTTSIQVLFFVQLPLYAQRPALTFVTPSFLAALLHHT